MKEEYKKLYEKRNELKQELNNNYGDDREKQRKLDLLKYQQEDVPSKLSISSGTVARTVFSTPFWLSV